ncbi:hypothetical protein ES708_09099 [subsurface metagenome]
MGTQELHIYTAKETIKAFQIGIDRLANVFSTIEQEAQTAADEHWEKSMSTPSSGDLDPGDFADQAIEHGAEVYESLYTARREYFSLSAVGLYHLWERPVRELFEVDPYSWTLVSDS